MVDETALTPYCPLFRHAIELIGRRWTGAIVRAMLAGAERFGDLAVAVPGLSDRLLSERLKELEAEGIVERRVVPLTPVRVEYHLTEKGRGLLAIVDSISVWANQWSTHETAGCSSNAVGDPIDEDSRRSAAPATPGGYGEAEAGRPR